jgi:hypothetical protein
MNANYSEEMPSIPGWTVTPGHAAAPTTKHHDSVSMRPYGQRCVMGRPSDRALYLFLLPPCAPPLVTIKGRGGQQLQGLDVLQIKHHFKGLGSDTLSRPVCNPYYKHS